MVCVIIVQKEHTKMKWEKGLAKFVQRVNTKEMKLPPHARLVLLEKFQAMVLHHAQNVRKGNIKIMQDSTHVKIVKKEEKQMIQEKQNVKDACGAAIKIKQVNRHVKLLNVVNHHQLVNPPHGIIMRET